MKKYITNLNEHAYHCEHCMCPVEQWEPLKTYNSDRSCELYSEFYDVIWELEEKKNAYNFDDILEKCKTFKEKYTDIEEFEAIIKECVDIGIDNGIITKLYTSSNPIIKINRLGLPVY